MSDFKSDIGFCNLGCLRNTLLEHHVAMRDIAFVRKENTIEQIANQSCDDPLMLFGQGDSLAALLNNFESAVIDVGFDGYTKIKPNSVAVINYRGEDGTPFMMPDADFRAAIHKFQHFEGVTSTESFAAETRYHYHDFSEDPQATGLLARTEIQSGQRDFSDWLRGRREAFDALVSRWENDTPFSNREPDAAGAERDGGGTGQDLRPSYGQGRDGAVSGVGVHYSTQPRQSLASGRTVRRSKPSVASAIFLETIGT